MEISAESRASGLKNIHGLIPAIISKYTFGKLIDFELMKAGFANINFKVKCNEGTYLLRFFQEKLKNEIEYEIRALNELIEYGFPAARSLKDSSGKYIQKTDIGPAVVYEFILGHEPEANTRTVGQIAGAVAMLSTFPGWKRFIRPNYFTINRSIDLIERFPEAENPIPDLMEMVEKEISGLRDILAVPLPEGLVHGDIFTDNTIFSRDRLQAVVDFEELCTDKLLFDVAMTITGFCFHDSELVPELKKTFMVEYQKRRMVTNKEIELLDPYIRWCNLTMLSWHLERLIFNTGKGDLNRAYFFAKRIKNLSE